MYMALILFVGVFLSVLFLLVYLLSVFLNLSYRLQLATTFVALGELEAGFSAELPLDGGCPALSDGGEVQEHDAEVQLAVDLGVVLIGLADEGDAAVADYEAIGLAVQAAGSQGGCVEGFTTAAILKRA